MRKQGRTAACVLAGALVVASGGFATAAVGAAPTAVAGQGAGQVSVEDPPPVPDGVNEVEGGDTRSNAVPIEIGRTYYDTIPDPADYDEGYIPAKYYRIQRSQPGSTIHYGVTLLGDEIDPRWRVSATALLDLPGEDQPKRCGFVAMKKQLAWRMPLSSRAGWTSGGQCAQAEEFNLAVYNEIEQPGKGRLPVPPPGTPYLLSVWEEPPVSNAAAIDAPAIYTEGDAQQMPPTAQAEPGATMVEAAAIEPYTTTLAEVPLGRIAWFSVPSEWNRALVARARVADPDGVARGAMIEMHIVSPLGGIAEYYNPYGTELPQRANMGFGPTDLSVRSAPVNPGQRMSASNYRADSALSTMPGSYYVAVWVQDTSGGDGEETVPVTLRVEQLEATNDETPEPVYDGDLTLPPAGAGPEAEAYDADDPTDIGDNGDVAVAAGAEGSGGDGGADGDGPDAAVIGAAAGGGVLLLLLLGGLAATLRSRVRTG